LTERKKSKIRGENLRKYFPLELFAHLYVFIAHVLSVKIGKIKTKYALLLKK